eukprot:1161765-Pelagomonas_calceolata.AAC.16
MQAHAAPAHAAHQGCVLKSRATELHHLMPHTWEASLSRASLKGCTSSCRLLSSSRLSTEDAGKRVTPAATDRRA